MSEKVLVTGGFGLVGSQTVRRLVADGHRVVATDLGTAAQRKAAAALPAGAEAHWADLTDPGQVDRLLAETSPAAGWRRYPMRLISPLARRFLKSRAAYRDTPGRYADPWGAIRAGLGEPRPDAPSN